MYYFLVNPVSGNGAGKKTMKKLASYLDKMSISYSTIYTTVQKSMYEWARELTKPMDFSTEKINESKDQSFRKYPRKVVVIGGDGSFHEFLNGIVDFDSLNIGFIPSGRGNDFVRPLKVGKDPVKTLQKILQNNVRAADFIAVGDMRSLNVAGTGLDVDVLLEVQKMKKSNTLSYVKALAKKLKSFDPYELEIEVNGQKFSRSCIMAGVCNGTCFGGGIKLSPQSDIFDGKLNLIIMKIPQDGKIFPALARFVNGSHLELECTEQYICESVTVTNSTEEFYIELDGEIKKNQKLDCKIEKGKLKILN